MIKDLVSQVSSGNDLSLYDMSNAMNEILNGTHNDQDIANFLKNKNKGVFVFYMMKGKSIFF